MVDDKVVIKIRTDYWRKPIPSRMHDWSAWVDGDEEFGSGTGPTKEKAVQELREMLECHDVPFDELEVIDG